MDAHACDVCGRRPLWAGYGHALCTRHIRVPITMIPRARNQYQHTGNTVWDEPGPLGTGRRSPLPHDQA